MDYDKEINIQRIGDTFMSVYVKTHDDITITGIIDLNNHMILICKVLEKLPDDIKRNIFNKYIGKILKEEDNSLFYVHRFRNIQLVQYTASDAEVDSDFEYESE